MESVRLTPAELAEITAKIANELEEYQDQATGDLRSGFLKLVEACEATTEHIYVTTLMAKWRISFGEDRFPDNRLKVAMLQNRGKWVGNKGVALLQCFGGMTYLIPIAASGRL